MVAAPTPTRVPRAAEIFIKGKVTASPEIARGPEPGIWPMKMLSTILYKEDAVMAMMPGTAYCLRRAFMLFVPNSVGMLPAISYLLSTTWNSKHRGENGGIADPMPLYEYPCAE